MASIKVACVVLICMVVVGALIAQATITCDQVVSGLAPCLTYLQSGGAVPVTCCNGVKGLVALPKSTADKQTICNCLKSAASSTQFDPANAASLPGKCGVNLPYKITPSTDCNTIKF
ncbi:PREDICTED: non-specific lipid-transfer protein 1-like isoform X1 [Lupinus angustifolius]|uniref:non-specific lipid-transfer protein 1-like isoform X1 n=1 Tax=Lupinus angustifolius TaxID=3871 RepID=UPI00092E2442|nr:PREDICTED: non-specific lipid-transfer protein 1-like isoform X1 [Lupinus angustifolius]